LAATLVLSACIGDDDDDEPTPTATQAAATVAAPTTAAGGTDGETTPESEPTFDMAALEATSNAQSTMIAEFTGEIDACKLVSREDAEEIIGAKLSGDPFKGGPGFEQAKSFCNYNPESVPGTAVVLGTTIQLVAFNEDDLKALGFADDLETFWEDTKTSAQEDEGFVEVDDVGDDAYFTTDDGFAAREGGTLIAVQGLPQDQATEFVKKAIDNL
jgi:hypothetical protein